MVGTVKSFDIDAGSNSYRIILKLSTSFNDVSYVYVVNNLLKNERKQLEEKQKMLPEVIKSVLRFFLLILLQ